MLAFIMLWQLACAMLAHASAQLTACWPILQVVCTAHTKNSASSINNTFTM
jgi:hypothetical protein